MALFVHNKSKNPHENKQPPKAIVSPQVKKILNSP